jgi:hypothetical protein
MYSAVGAANLSAIALENGKMGETLKKDHEAFYLFFIYPCSLYEKAE